MVSESAYEKEGRLRDVRQVCESCTFGVAISNGNAKVEPRLRVRIINFYICSLDDMRKHCLEEFRKHWECLDNNNHQLYQCRRPERKLNKCVFDNLVRVGFALHSEIFTNIDSRN